MSVPTYAAQAAWQIRSVQKPHPHQEGTFFDMRSLIFNAILASVILSAPAAAITMPVANGQLVHTVTQPESTAPTATERQRMGNCQWIEGHLPAKRLAAGMDMCGWWSMMDVRRWFH